MNKNILNMHLDILDNKRQKLLQKLLPIAKDFVLGGGTALALQLAHRKSFDFDFFSPSPIHKRLLEKLSQELSIQNIAVDTPDELTFFDSDDIKITFLYYPFKSYFEVLELENGLRIFPIKEIALQKMSLSDKISDKNEYVGRFSLLSCLITLCGLAPRRTRMASAG